MFSGTVLTVVYNCSDGIKGDVFSVLHSVPDSPRLLPLSNALERKVCSAHLAEAFVRVSFVCACVCVCM